jgi:tRNA nucleotidyltransferase (CCA-adding enzyme)
MPDYIYLLENRLSPEQQRALRRTTEAARARGMTVFLAGGAVRDFTSGSPVRDLDVSVQGNALKLLKDLEKFDAILLGEHAPSQTLYLKFPGGVRIEVSSTRSERFPKPGKPEYHPANILEDLRRRDFTVNAR